MIATNDQNKRYSELDRDIHVETGRRESQTGWDEGERRRR